MHINPDITACSIVLLGQFNPAIFHPAWLRAKGIEPDISGENAQVNIIHPTVANFVVNGRGYSIEQGRFHIGTQSGPWVMIADITRMIFGEYLVHTPIHIFGVNRGVHFRLPSPEARVKLGRLLAPIEPWGEFGKQLESADASRLVGGLQRLTMRSHASSIESASISTNVTIEPSVEISDASGVYMEVNAHHEMIDLPAGYGANHAIELLSTRFESLIEEADKIIDSIMKAGKKYE